MLPPPAEQPPREPALPLCGAELFPGHAVGSELPGSGVTASCQRRFSRKC